MFAYLATVTLENASGLVKDQVVNTFTFQTDGAMLSADADAIRDRLDAFYHDLGEGAAHPIGYYLSGSLSRVVKPIVRLYDVTANLGGNDHGSPVWIRTFNNNLPANGANGLPAEMAIALSFHAPFGLDQEFAPGSRPRARDRGRVYIGPLTVDTLAYGTVNRCQVASAAQLAVLGAGKDLLDGATAQGRWSVWSRKNGAVVPVEKVSVDNAFDVQRRRGEDADAKLVLP